MQAETKRNASRVTWRSCNDAPDRHAGGHRGEEEQRVGRHHADLLDRPHRIDVIETLARAAHGLRRGRVGTRRPSGTRDGMQDRACPARAGRADAPCPLRPSGARHDVQRDRSPRSAPGRGPARALMRATTTPARDSLARVSTPSRTTKATGTWPNSGSSRPTTATAATAGSALTTSSISRGKTFSPPRLMTSSLRATEVEVTVGVAVARGLRCGASRPGRKRSACVAARRRPSITDGPRISTWPTSAGAHSVGPDRRRRRRRTTRSSTPDRHADRAGTARHRQWDGR